MRRPPLRLTERLRAFLRPADFGPGLVAHAPAVAPLALVRAFWPFARPYRRWILIGLPLLLVVPAIEALEILLFKLVVDDVLVPRELAALWPIAAAYLGLALLGALAGFADEYLATWLGERLLMDLRARVHAHVHALSPAQLERRRPGDLLARLTGDVGAIERLLLSVLGEGIGALARIAFFGGALFLLSWRLALAALVVVPLFLIISRHFARLIRHAAREKRRRSGSLTAVAEESLGAIPLTQSLNRQAEEAARFRRQNEGIVDAELAATRISGFFGPLAGLVELLGGMLVLALGVLALRSGDLTLGGLLVFVTYLTQLYSPIRSLGALSGDLFAAAAGAERVLELLREESWVSDRPGARPLPSPVSGRIEFDDVSYTHPGARRPALAGVSLSIEPGETVALVGASGAGKSTLARLLMRYADPQSGAVRLDDHDMRDLTLQSLREAVGLVLQDTVLPDATAGEAIAQGRPGATRAQVVAAARAAGVLDVLEALPEGLDTRLGPRGEGLSGGERRRVAIARAFLRDSPVLILDEPTTGLDVAARDALMAPLRELTRGRTTVLITHDPVVVGWADRVLELGDGRLLPAAAGMSAA